MCTVGGVCVCIWMCVYVRMCKHTYVRVPCVLMYTCVYDFIKPQHSYDGVNDGVWHHPLS